MTNPTSNFGWQMPTSTDLVTDLPADFEVFGQAVDTDFVDLLGGANGYILSKASATDLDFTWIANDQGDITGITATSPLTGGGSSGAITVGIQDATTSVKGSVQLSDSTSTTSSVLASTPTATKSAYDLADAAIPKSTVTTAGDVIYATGSSAVTRLGIGSTGQVLTVAAGAPSWATISTAPTFVGCVVTNNGTSQSFTSGADNVLLCPTESIDTDGFHSTSSNTSRITIPSGKAGKYAINGTVRQDAGVPSYNILKIMKNGSGYTADGLGNGQLSRTENGSNTSVLNGSIVISLSAADYIELVLQNASSTSSYTFQVQFSAVYLGS